MFHKNPKLLLFSHIKKYSREVLDMLLIKVTMQPDHFLVKKEINRQYSSVSDKAVILQGYQ